MCVLNKNNAELFRFAFPCILMCSAYRVRRRHDVDAVISAAIYIYVHHRRRLHDRLYSGRFLIVQNSSAGYIDESQNRFDAPDRLVGHDVVDAMLVQMMLELAVRDTYPAPVIVRVVQVSLAAMQEDELSVPRALVTMTEQLTIQSDLAILETLLFPGTLQNV